MTLAYAVRLRVVAKYLAQLGVVLALAANEWREVRNDEAHARHALAAIAFEEGDHDFVQTRRQRQVVVTLGTAFSLVAGLVQRGHHVCVLAAEGGLAVVLMAFVAVGWARHRDRYRAWVVVPASVVIGLTALYWSYERIF